MKNLSLNILFVTLILLSSCKNEKNKNKNNNSNNNTDSNIDNNRSLNTLQKENINTGNETEEDKLEKQKKKFIESQKKKGLLWNTPEAIETLNQIATKFSDAERIKIFNDSLQQTCSNNFIDKISEKQLDALKLCPKDLLKQILDKILVSNTSMDISNATTTVFTEENILSYEKLNNSSPKFVEKLLSSIDQKINLYPNPEIFKAYKDLSQKQLNILAKKDYLPCSETSVEAIKKLKELSDEKLNLLVDKKLSFGNSDPERLKIFDWVKSTDFEKVKELITVYNSSEEYVLTSNLGKPRIDWDKLNKICNMSIDKVKIFTKNLNPYGLKCDEQQAFFNELTDDKITALEQLSTSQIDILLGSLIPENSNSTPKDAREKFKNLTPLKITALGKMKKDQLKQIIIDDPKLQQDDQYYTKIKTT